jgi:RNA polymerase sigma-70 factor, ECF subfamily
MGREEDPTDADLIRAAHRDPTAFPALYDRYARRAVGWARRDGVPEADVVDLVGELFAQAWRSLRRYRDPGDGSAGAWLHGISRHLVASYHRRGRAEDAARRRLGLELDYGGAHDEELPGERGDALDDALAELPPAQAAAVRLRVVDELAYEDIGLRLSCTPVAARKQVSLGLRTLRAALKEESR